MAGEINVQPDSLELTAAGGEVIESGKSSVIRHSAFGISNMATDKRMRDAAKLLGFALFPA